MKLTNLQIINSMGVIKKLSDSVIPVKTGLILLKNIKKLSDVHAIFETTRSALISEHAQKDEEGNILPVRGDNGEIIPDRVQIKDADAFTKALAELLSVEADVEIEKVSVDSLSDVKLMIGELTHVEWLFN
jgi:hypothetical protein